MSNKKIKILVVAGVRPQFVKCAAFQHGLINIDINLKQNIVFEYINSGQHYDSNLSDVFIEQLNIHFDYVVSHDDKLPAIVLGNMIVQISKYIQNMDIKPDWVIVFGDANTTLAGAIAANKCKCKVAHFEAGTAVKELRTPEVLNGRLLAQLVDVHLCSTQLSLESLKKAGVTDNVYVVGDVAREYVINYAETVEKSYKNYTPDEYILLTLHREENLESEAVLFNLLNGIDKKYKTLFVAHPRTQKKLDNMEIAHLSNIHIVSSLSYSEMISAIKGCRYIITDSGGLQREAYYLGKRCLVCSEVDFWPILRLEGVHRIVDQDLVSIRNGIEWIEGKLNVQFPSVPELDRSNVLERALAILNDLRK